MTIKRMDHVGIVVEDLAAATAFFVELGMELIGQGPAEGPWLDGVNGLDDVRVDVAFLRTPDGHGQIELASFRNPLATTSEPNAPANTLGIRNVMFAVDDIEETVARLKPHGGELIGRIERYQDSYLLCYLRGPQGIIVALAEEIG
ncbi:VOC family protein [Kribbella deserti]|uniref:VOC family protein n=1 Tax=Kribbella deserti TaxID=1926257 RepID=A0ABV6QF84_9ACTN